MRLEEELILGDKAYIGSGVLTPKRSNMTRSSKEAVLVRPWTRVVRTFPNRESCLRLVTALCVEVSDEWVSGKRYLDMGWSFDPVEQEEFIPV